MNSGLGPASITLARSESSVPGLQPMPLPRLFGLAALARWLRLPALLAVWRVVVGRRTAQVPGLRCQDVRHGRDSL